MNLDTEKRIAELEHKLGWWKSVLDGSPDAVLVTDAAGRLVEYNSRLTQLAGPDIASWRVLRNLRPSWQGR